jgi:acylphosphatase
VNIMKRIHAYVSGRVQGVFFRGAAQRTATDLNLTGWVRNMEDGRVEVLLEGEDTAVNKMVAWCKIGPPAARVDYVTIAEEPFTGSFRGFRISY